MLVGAVEKRRGKEQKMLMSPTSVPCRGMACLLHVRVYTLSPHIPLRNMLSPPLDAQPEGKERSN